MNINDLLDKARAALSGEPARFIGYGSAIVVVGVVAVANQLGITRFGSNLSLTDALVGSTAAIATLTGLVEAVRRAVYSPASVQVIATNAAASGDDTIPAPPADDAVVDGAAVDGAIGPDPIV